MSKTIDARSVISDYIFLSKYARTVHGRKETWNEAVSRVMTMHWEKISQQVNHDSTRLAKIKPYFDFASEYYHARKILGAQRALQYGGEQLKKHNGRMYNCTASYLDRVDFFRQCFGLLLMGCGTGYSVYKENIDKLPIILGSSKESFEFIVPDSIEGWTEALDALIKSHVNHSAKPKFDFSKVRPKGAMISGGFIAPGPDELEVALHKIDKLLTDAAGRKLRPFEAHRIVCLLAVCVKSGGLRRSALISMFDADDIEMLTCKTGDWFVRYPELAMANNTVAILPDTDKDVYLNVFKSVKEFSEPGIAFVKSKTFVYNPCFEVGMYPEIEINGNIESGWSVCNLTEVIAGTLEDSEDFLKRAKAAAILGTFQAMYTDFTFIGSTTEEIVKRDALIGVGITGMCEKPSIVFDANVQKRGAEIVKHTNIELAALLDINPAARTTVIKPSGNSAQLVGTSSGIHPFHSQKYIRHIQATESEQAANIYGFYNEHAISKSVYGGNVLAFPVTINDDAMFLEDLSAIDFLENVKLTQDNWIEYGTNFDHPSYKANPELRHNVSNTCTVRPNEWDAVAEYLWTNRESFCGVSMTPATGDLNYPQAPCTSYLDEHELASVYGAASILAGGLIVDGISAFSDLWLACDTAIGRGEKLELTSNNISEQFSKHLVKTADGFKFETSIDGLFVTDSNAFIQILEDKLKVKKDWVRRFKKFAKNYFANDLEKTANCLKHVNIFHKWQKISKINVVDWQQIEWSEVGSIAGSDLAAACSGGKCEI